MIQERRILYEHLDVPNINTFDVFRQYGGYKGFEKAIREHKPEEIADMVMTSGLKGRGGAGFSTGLKWSFVPRNIEPRYLCCNADESEPGTFSNRYVLEKNPHLLIESILIACYALGIHTTYVYIRGEFTLGKRMLDQAIEEAYQRGYLGKNILGTGFNLDIYTHPGAGAYICGEETGLIESLEGKRGQPRVKPPFPAVAGLFAKPTVVQNVETLCNLPFLLQHGVEWYRSMGRIYVDTRMNPPQETPDTRNTGTKLYCVSGDVNKPGVYELELGLTCNELIEVAGGVKGGRVKGVIPGGSSAAILTSDELDYRLDFTTLGLARTMLGSGGIIVLNETRCMVDALLNVLKFYAHESCGQCTPCRWGTPWVRDIMDRIEHGKGRKTTVTRPKFGIAANGRWGDTSEMEEIYEDLDLLESVAQNIGNVDTMTYNTICQFGIAVSWPAVSYMRKFRPEFEAHIREGKCVVLPPDEAKVPPKENYGLQQRIIPKTMAELKA
ncbi:NADH-quinone oxidoreductase subunit NuoF [Candidatus Poribacteria bacterium]|nr:NADH-quinone oxidoreductase subunit NuoF [Candidatus Poribacteria bacterium]